MDEITCKASIELTILTELK